MHTETAHEIVAVRLDRREAAQVAKAVQQTGQSETDQADFLIRAALKEAKTILQHTPASPDTNSPQ